MDNALIVGQIFTVEDDHLVRRVVPNIGKPYEHRCPRAAFEQIAHAAEELGDGGFTIGTLLSYERDATRFVSWTNVAIVIAFLRERSILDVRHRTNYSASPTVHLDAMTEFHALAEEPR